jgi:ABC-type protease/lipase transport system fused ATPase/permease subunit
MITLFGLLFTLANPKALLQSFLMAGVVLYGWFANRFYVYVMIGKQKINKKQKDWLQVNAIVAFVVSILGITESIYILYHPHVFDNILKDLPAQNSPPQNLIINVAIILLAVCVILLMHIIWTYVLIRKNKAYISEAD